MTSEKKGSNDQKLEIIHAARDFFWTEDMKRQQWQTLYQNLAFLMFPSIAISNLKMNFLKL